MNNTLLNTALAIVLITAFVASLVTGPAAIPLSQSFEALFGGANEAAVLVMQEIRLPRAILGLLIGATLGLTGAVLQGYLRNPLADPGILGISSAAALGAVIAIYSGLAAMLPITLPVAAMAGALLAVFLIHRLAGRHAGTITLILAGLAISTLGGALTTLALNLSPNPYAALEIVFWMLGSLTDRSWLHVTLAAPFMIAGWFMLFAAARALDALTLGSDVAATIGIDLARTRTLIVIGAAISVGAATAVAGAIGFVGLVVPHVLRPLVGHQPSRLLPASALAGGALILAADVAVRVIAPARDIKLGVRTALIGAPFFVWLVFKTRRELV
ncbi:MAG: iron ABC transporter permease [Alphaproteobacteria bacterium]|nr:iron ABC transporter permease [Alphaproteobacteria bacterium]